jgi:hypothetical protein
VNIDAGSRGLLQLLPANTRWSNLQFDLPRCHFTLPFYLAFSPVFCFICLPSFHFALLLPNLSQQALDSNSTMAPPTSTMTETSTTTAPTQTTPPAGLNTPSAQPASTAPHEPKINSQTAQAQLMKFPAPPTFTDKYVERTYLKGRLALAFRLFGKLGYDEGVAGSGSKDHSSKIGVALT